MDVYPFWLNRAQALRSSFACAVVTTVTPFGLPALYAWSDTIINLVKCFLLSLPPPFLCSSAAGFFKEGRNLYQPPFSG